MYISWGMGRVCIGPEAPGGLVGGRTSIIKARSREAAGRAGKMRAAPWLARWGGEAGVGSWVAPAPPRPELRVSPPPLPASGLKLPVSISSLCSSAALPVEHPPLVFAG